MSARPAVALWGDVRFQPAHCLAIQQTLEGLEDHDRGDASTGTDGRPRSGREQVGEQLVAEHRRTVLGQGGMYQAIPQQMQAQRCVVQQFPIGARRTLDAFLGSHSRQRCQHPRGVAQRSPRMTP